MNEMYFKSILIADIKEKTACFQKFEKGFNVITSQENHVGKSSMLKSLYYAMGAEIDYDNIWDKNTKIYIVNICINEKNYTIARFQKGFALFEENNLILLTKSASYELPKKYEELFSFAVYLPNKRTKKIELAPPVFTFLPYYIDQDKGWSGLYDSFLNLNQYDKTDRIKSLYYHLNIYNRETIELMAQRDIIKEKKKKLKEKEEKIRIILQALLEETRNLLPADNLDELERNLQIPKEKISILVLELGNLRNKIQTLETTMAQHEHQLEIIHEYKKIKINTEIENEQEMLHTCPKCGYMFDEEIYDIVRSNYNVHNETYMCQQIQLIINSISSELEIYKEKYVKAMAELEKQEKIYDESQDSYEVYIRQRGLKDSVNHFNEQLSDNVYQQKQCEKQVKEIDKKLRKLPNKKEIEEKYTEKVRLDIIKLDAWNAAYDGKIKLLNPIKAQGTLENKIILAQVAGLFQTMDALQSDTIRFPFVVDSPRAKEASHTSSKEILKLIFEMNMLPQIILATMDYNDFEEEIKAYEKKFEENLSTNKENNSDLENVIMKVDSTTIKPTSISIIIINNNDNEIGYDQEYKIQKNINGEWKYLDYLPNTSWNDIAYIIKANSQTTKKLNLENTYGELEKGTYRIIKTMFSENGKKADIYSNEFEIK